MSSSPATAAAPSDLPARRLASIRAELDRVDDALHDALMRRAELVVQVGASRAKGNVPLRPGREAAIIRRLLARNHGALDPALLVRLWREMISGFTVQQRQLTIAVEDGALLPMTQSHFGLLATAELAGTADAAMQRVAAGDATACVLRWPGEWWHSLLDGRAASLHVVARLPFWGQSVSDAMILTAAQPDPSGNDRTLIGTLTPTPAITEIDGFVETAPAPYRVLGAYATPIGASL